MTTVSEELQELESRIDAQAKRAEVTTGDLRSRIDRLQRSIRQAAEAWSGSDIGYHSRLYYDGFERPPLHRSFDVDWGGIHGIPEGWDERSVDDVLGFVEATSNVAVADAEGDVESLIKESQQLNADVCVGLSVIGAMDGLEREKALLAELEAQSWGTRPAYNAGGYRISRDMRAMSEGIRVPPHRVIANRVGFISSQVDAVEDFLGRARRAVRQTARLLQLDAPEPAAAQDPLTPLLTLCRRFDAIARQLTIRQRKRTPYEINDEYDVQDLMHALLWLHFEDVRPEEWTPSYAGASSRMDFLLKRERTVVEVKKTRNGLADKELGEELLVDIARYAEHPAVDTLVCFVFDPERRVSNPRGLEDDLSRQSSGNLRVEAIVG